jgi:hypothetical protein
LGGFVARRFTAPAAFSTYLAMIVLVGVLFAFLGAGTAGYSAGLHRRDDDPFVAPRAADADRACSQTQVGAILIQPNALTKLAYHVFGHARISTSNAGLRTRVTFLKTADQSIVSATLNAWVRCNHLLHMVHDVLP